MKKSIRDLNLGLAFSGGGIRAIVFHAGVLEYLAKINLLESVKVISTVSGGSIFISLVYSLNGNKWPTSYEYLTKILPKIKGITCNISISKDWYVHLLNPFYWKYMPQRAKILAITLENKWDITGNINELPDSPKWYITSTVAKNGTKWTICQDYMGTKCFGFTKKPNIKIADAVAASAAYPGIIGPYQLNTSDYIWYKNIPEGNTPGNEIITPDNPIYYFYDGGLYDNIGCDSLFTEFGVELIEGIDTIIMSNACAPMNSDWFSKWNLLARTKKMVDMMLTHVDQIRLKWLKSYLDHNKKLGVLVKIGLHHSELIPPNKRSLFRNIIPMPMKSIDIVRGVKTHLNKISPQEYESTKRNGYETALIKSRLYYDYYRNKNKINI